MLPQKLPLSRRRPGFTLVELLMVIAIISILMGLSFYVMSGITESAQQEATKTVVNKVSRLMEQRMEAFDRAFKGGRKDAYVKATVQLLMNVDGRFDHFLKHPEQVPASFNILARKAGFRYEFPQRMVERILAAGDDANGNGLPDVIEESVAIPSARTFLISENLKLDNPDPTYDPSAADIATVVSRRWAGGVANYTLRQTTMPNNVAASTTFTGHDPVTESSELLYYTLTASGTFGASPVDVDQFTSQEVADTDSDGLLEFIDAYDQPLRFYRWPTRLIDPTAPNPFAPDFDTVGDPTEVDPSPDDNESDGLREILTSERTYAGILIRGLPPAPTPLVGPTGGLTTQRDMLFVDPDDPVGLLYSLIEDPQYQAMGIDLTVEINEGKYHTPDTYHVPLIVSAGPDGELGLYEPYQIDYDLNQNGTVDAGEETVGVVDGVNLNNGTFDGVLGNLAQYYGTYITTDGNGATETPSAVVTDSILDNVTNRNRRPGAKR